MMLSSRCWKSSNAHVAGGQRTSRWFRSSHLRSQSSVLCSKQVSYHYQSMKSNLYTLLKTGQLPLVYAVNPMYSAQNRLVTTSLRSQSSTLCSKQVSYHQSRQSILSTLLKTDQLLLFYEFNPLYSAQNRLVATSLRIQSSVLCTKQLSYYQSTNSILCTPHKTSQLPLVYEFNPLYSAQNR